MKKIIKKVSCFALAFAFVLSSMTVVHAADTPKSPIVFEDFENSTNAMIANNDTSVDVVVDPMQDNNKVLQLTTTSSDWPHMTYRSTIIKFSNVNQSIDVSDYKYLTFKMLDTQGSNSSRVSLIDINGNIDSGDGQWTSQNAVHNEWTHLSIELSNFSGLDLTQIVGLYIGEWNAGTYFIDDIMFTDILASELSVEANKTSGTYYNSFGLKLTAGENQNIYYTTDGSTPTVNSQVFDSAIAIDQTMTIKAISEINGNISDVVEFNYTISNEVNAPLIFEDFENSTKDIAATGDSSVEITSDTSKNGSSVLKLTTTSSDWPHMGYRSTIVKFSDENEYVDVSDYTYLTFNLLEKGTNSARVSLIDINGNSVDGEWTGNVVSNEWTQLSVSLSQFKEHIDLTKVVGLYIGEWNSGTYYIDDIMFTNILDSEMKVTANKDSGTYYDSFEVTLSANEDLTIYYTTDGTLPTTSSEVYKKPITVDDSMTIKAITELNGNVSNICTFNYIIDHEDQSIRTPVFVQNFENGKPYTALTGATGVISSSSHSGNSSLEYTKTKSESASTTKGSMVIDFDHAVNVESLNYLVFYFKDTQGSNTMQVSLLDAHGNESSFSWRELSTVKNSWMQYYVKLADFSGIDLTQVTGMRIGQWNSGVYYVDNIYFDNYLYTGVPSEVPTVPTSSVASGYMFKSYLDVTLKNDNNAPMYYTLDGSTPTTDSSLYEGIITLSDTTTLKAVSYANGKYSDVIEWNYIKNDSVINDVKTNKQPGNYSKAFEVSLSQEDGYTIYYTTDGSTPTLTSSKYSAPIQVNENLTIKAFAYDGENNGNVMTFNYVIPTTPKAVTTSVDSYTFSSTTNVELISDLDAEIYYTTDGTTPSEESIHYDEPISVSQTMTVKAIAVRNGHTTKVATYNFVIAPQAVEADKPAGTYDGSVLVEFRVPDTDQVEIYYTTDGTEPTINSIHYEKPIIVSENTTFKVAATYKNGNSLSVSSTHEYVINPVEDVVEPIINPEDGTYGQRQLVTMTTDTADATIYYTTDGSNPTVNSQKYTEGFYITEDAVIKAVAIKNNISSDVVTRTITITDEVSPFLKVDGEVIRNNYGGGDIVQLKGTNIGGWLVMEEWQCPTNAVDQITMIETLTERFGEEKAWELINAYQDSWFTEEDMIVLKEEGVNCLRLPITYFEMCNDDGSLKESAFDRLDWFVETAAKYEIYVMIDMHGAFGSQNGKDHSGDTTIANVGNFYGNEENIQKTIDLWEEIARRYNGNEWVAGYDLLNEPSAVGTEQFEVYDRIYDAIRAIDQDHIIYIQAIWEPTHLPDPDYYDWENIVYEYHFYGWNVEKDAEGQKAFIESKVEYLKQTDFGVPVFVGEFTFFSNMKSWEYGLDIFDEQGWSYTSWTYKVAGDGSSWGMYTMPKNDNTSVDIYNDSYETILEKWTTFNFTRNDDVADILSAHFKGVAVDMIAPVIDGHDATTTVGDTRSVEELIDLYIKDHQEGVIANSEATITTDYDASKEGTYTVKVVVSDESGNESEATFSIIVKAKTVDDDTTNPGGNENNTDNNNQTPGSSINPDNSNTNNTTNGTIQTGDMMIEPYMILIGLSMIVIVLLKKRKLVK